VVVEPGKPRAVDARAGTCQPDSDSARGESVPTYLPAYLPTYYVGRPPMLLPHHLHSVTHLLTHSSTHPSTHPFTHPFSILHSPSIHPLTHSPTCLSIPPPLPAAAAPMHRTLHTTMLAGPVCARRRPPPPRQARSFSRRSGRRDAPTWLSAARDQRSGCTAPMLPCSALPCPLHPLNGSL
jgi:hypothetical protein